MDFVNSVLIVLICIGFGFIIFSLFKKDDSKSEGINIDAVNKLIDNSLADIDNAMGQLNSLSNDVFKEFEEKYQQLLFLYQLIDDKKEEVINLQHKSNIVNKRKRKNFKYNNPYLEEILKLQSQGLSIAEISKTLGIGQGEVKLIAELGKKG